MTTRFAGDDDGRVRDAARTRRPRRRRRSGRSRAPSGELEADLVLLAMGFLHPEQDGCSTQLGVEKDARGNVEGAAVRDVGRRASSPPATRAAASR